MNVENIFWRAAMAAVLAVLLAACQADSADKAKQDDKDSSGDKSVQTIEVQVRYRDRSMLPPDAEVQVQLQDVSRADAMATVMETVSMPAKKGPPYKLDVTYRPDQIVKKNRYALRATITRNDVLLYTSTEYIDPFAGNGPIEIMVERVPQTVSTKPQQTIASPEDAIWQLVKLGGGEVGAGAAGKPLSLQFNGSAQQVSGFSGCNNFSGSYELTEMTPSSGNLSMGPLAATRKACVEGMGQEQGYLDTLGTTDAYQLDGDKMVLLSQGSVVAEFKTAS